MKLDLGCGNTKREGAFGVDHKYFKGVNLVHDLNVYPYLITRESYDDVLLDNSLEHINDTVKTMEEIHRILEPGGRVVIKVPYYRSVFAIDPTHKQYFNSFSFDYFDPEKDYYKYGYSDARFRVAHVEFDTDFRWSLVKWFANRWPVKYETRLSHLFPLRELTFTLYKRGA